MCCTCTCMSNVPSKQIASNWLIYVGKGADFAELVPTITIAIHHTYVNVEQAHAVFQEKKDILSHAYFLTLNGSNG